MNAAPALILRAEFQDPQSSDGIVRRAQEGGNTASGTQQPTAPGGDFCSSQSLPLLIAFPLLLYFLLIRPQQKQDKERKAMLAAVKQGDKVVTTGGLWGTVSSLDAETATLRIDPKVKITVDRSAIARVVGRDAEEPKS